jgi:hypothetical protein
MAAPHCDQAIQVRQPTANSQAVAVDQGTSILILTNTANYTGLQVTFPQNAVNGQFFTIMMGTTNSITITNVAGASAYTFVNPVTGLAPGTAMTAAANGCSVTYLYQAAGNRWIRYARA